MGKRCQRRGLGISFHQFAAPEQFGLPRSDVRTDIYAVGILLNILLTGVHPAVEQYRSGDQKTKRRRIYKIIAAACFVPLFLLGFIIFDSIYYPTVETEDFSMSDSACLVCTKEGNIYILYRNNAKRLELPVLDFYREKTGEKAKVQATQNGTVKMGSIEYNI